MDRSSVIYLISEEKQQDATGVLRKTYSRRKVFADANSVTYSEFFEGGRNGLNPEFQFRMFAPDYQGEKLVEYRGRTYSVYRTYIRRTDEIEIYVEQKGGTNGEGNG